MYSVYNITQLSIIYLIILYILQNPIFRYSNMIHDPEYNCHKYIFFNLRIIYDMIEK